MKSLFSTRCHLEVFAAEPLLFLKKLSQSGVTLHNVIIVDTLTARFEVDGAYMRTVRCIADRLSIEIRILRMEGFLQVLNILRQRIGLVLGIAIIAALTIYIPTRIFFVDITGDAQIDKTYLLEQAEKVGIFFGASRKAVRSEQVKNALLQAVPELKWAGINTYGCRAEIYILARDVNISSESVQVQGIYALRDGVVTDITVTKGTAQCKTGQAVRAGQLLVSGYSDRGLVLRADGAEGEVYGVTRRSVDAVMPAYHVRRGEITENFVNWSLCIGKKQIKLHIDSGNYDSECGKIYKTYSLTLPGGFILPVSVVKETMIAYNQYPAERIDSSGIFKLADSYILSNMIAGKVIHTNTQVVSQNETVSLVGVYTCEELIGKIKYEEIK